jgi:hypothetical protein
MGIDLSEMVRKTLRLVILGSGPSVITGLIQIIEPRVFGRGAHLAGIQSFNLHGFTAAFRNTRVLAVVLSFVPAIHTFETYLFCHEFLPSIDQ